MPDTSRELPFIDEHSREVAASAEAAWDAVNHVVRRSFSGQAKSAVARVLCCTETELTGFRVAASRPPEVLELQGRHRFSAYELNFYVESLGPERSRVRAETRATFPGLAGRAYEAAVMGSRGHVAAVNSLLGATAARAERAR